MSTLSKEFRRQLERVVLAARDESERGAAAALESFGVADAKLPGHLDDAGKNLRRTLRAHGRQVGDVRRPDESQEVEHLVHECAYEHWHRMLFARFLAENGFLIEPESGLDVDLDFCEERARETTSDKWEVAAGFAQRMLPGIFRPDDPVLQLRLPAESRNRLTALLASLPSDVFLTDDSLGWVYQFWQTEQKKKISSSEVPIGADELSPVTQLFTEDYMVEFLLHNTLGAWWTAKRQAEGKSQPIAFTYLRLKEDGTPAAGAFEGWPKTVKELRVLDPCMGSGHFLVFALVILVRMRIEEEGLSAANACVAVLRENLFGLELDPRCTQIAAFNLALAAWKAGGYQALPALNLACSGLAPNAKRDDWLNLAAGNANLTFAMGALYDLFQKAPLLGSLIDPRRDKAVTYATTLRELEPLMAQAIQREKTDEAHELAVAAHGVARAVEILASQFTLVATNVPFKETKQLVIPLREHIEANFNEGRINLATAFLVRICHFLSDGGTAAVVTPHEWLFLKTYTPTREKMLRCSTWRFLADLGEHGFESSQAAGAFTALISFTNSMPQETNQYTGWDLTKLKSPQHKAIGLRETEALLVLQSDQLKNPDARIGLSSASDLPLLSKYAGSYVGLQNGDTPRFVFYFWEIPMLDSVWSCFELPCDLPKPFGGREGILRWENGVGVLASASYARVQGTEAWKKQGVAIRQTRTLPATRYTGDLYDQSSAAIIPFNPSDLPAVWAYCSSPQFHDDVRRIDKKKNVTNATLVKVPFDLEHWQKVAAEKYPHGLPKPFSSDPTQWLFNGHPKQQAGPEVQTTEHTEDTEKKGQPSSSPSVCSVYSVVHPASLQVAVARLVGYQWPRQTGSSFPDCPALGPDGLEKHADKDGVVCFSQVRDEAPAATRLRALLADAYGKEWSHAMERKLIAATGSDADSLEDWLLNDFFAQHCDLFHNRPFVWHIWDGRKDGFNVLVNYHKLAGGNHGIHGTHGKEGSTSPRPSPQSGEGEAHAGRQTLETLAYAYLGDWITRQKDAVAHGEAGADDRLAAAQELLGELKKIVAGEPPYDLFIRWKPLHEQAVGWQPDINDGVRLNIRPFLVASLSRGKKGCGLFRAKPGSSVKWEKDRGKEPSRPKEDFPWFWGWENATAEEKDGRSAFLGSGGEPDGNRWNDCHYTTACKRAARERKK